MAYQAAGCMAAEQGNAMIGSRTGLMCGRVYESQEGKGASFLAGRHLAGRGRRAPLTTLWTCMTSSLPDQACNVLAGCTLRMHTLAVLPPPLGDCWPGGGSSRQVSGRELWAGAGGGPCSGSQSGSSGGGGPLRLVDPLSHT